MIAGSGRCSMNYFRKFGTMSLKRHLMIIALLFILYALLVMYLNDAFFHRLYEPDRLGIWSKLIELTFQLIVATPAITIYLLLLYKEKKQTEKYVTYLEDITTQYRLTLDMIRNTVFIFADQTVVYCNDAALLLTGFASKEELLGKSYLTLFPHRNQVEHSPKDWKMDGKQHNEYVYLRPDGEIREVEYCGLPIRYEGRESLLVVVRDVTDYKRTSRELNTTQDQLTNILNSVDAAIWSFDVINNKMLFVSDAYKRIFGITSHEQLTPDFWLEMTMPEDRIILESMGEKMAVTGQPVSYEIRFRRANGTMGYFQCRVVPVKDRSGRIVRVDGVNVDITERVDSQKRIEFMAFHDELTGLPNRRYFRKKLKQSAAKSREGGHPFAVLYIDLDKFKIINDTLGHQTGDLFLKETAQRLLGAVNPETDTVARIGGDEFTMILHGFNDRSHLEQMICAVRHSFNEPFLFDGYEFVITASIGISVYPDDGTDLELLMNSADSAMFQAKESRNGYQYHNKESDQGNSEKVRIQNELRKALARQEFNIVYQPKHCVSNRELVGAEALIRWRHPQIGVIPPSQFISIAEDIGLIDEIGEWVLDRVCEQIAIWQNHETRITVSVNLSVNQFRKDKLAETIENTIRKHGIDPGLLELEITENMAMDMEKALPVLLNLKKIGIRISVDDFGTGYSSLNYLKRLPIDVLKIDQSFVKDILSDAGNAAIVSTVIALAHNLNLKVIAEGVETAEQFEALRALDCDEAQGYFFHKPLALQEFDDLLKASYRSR
jgi:diguanylate cyclase (GGDEF)-like protein/PAS domain S-box-containing protein